MNKRKTGKSYETMAEGYLTGAGWRILAKNYYSHFGELDLVALSPLGEIAAVEVKYRSSQAFGDPAEAVDARKQLRMARGLMAYCQEQGMLDHDLRFDIIAIYGDGTIRHLEHAFTVNI